MKCYAKDLKPGNLICGHGKGWIEVLNVRRSSTLAKSAVKYRYTHDVEITLLVRMSGEIIKESVNGHTVYEIV